MNLSLLHPFLSLVRLCCLAWLLLYSLFCLRLFVCCFGWSVSWLSFLVSVISQLFPSLVFVSPLCIILSLLSWNINSVLFSVCCGGCWFFEIGRTCLPFVCFPSLFVFVWDFEFIQCSLCLFAFNLKVFGGCLSLYLYSQSLLSR